ncbi:hypothetical protein L2E82_08033 [Cichorium intybus]|uniref:Uncharacterized protein n=1 Tax=Cichorium intybus TaxID=13427 RepID=A0ACB9G6C1_CICIN|nr:hypothetical protein L2E82_08033 [Cichorium intybus]
MRTKFITNGLNSRTHTSIHLLHMASSILNAFVILKGRITSKTTIKAGCCTKELVNNLLIGSIANEAKPEYSKGKTGNEELDAIVVSCYRIYNSTMLVSFHSSISISSTTNCSWEFARKQRILSTRMKRPTTNVVELHFSFGLTGLRMTLPESPSFPVNDERCTLENAITDPNTRSDP